MTRQNRLALGVLSKAAAFAVAGFVTSPAWSDTLPAVGSGSLLLHLKADAANVSLGDDNHVTNWSDLSGNSNHFFQADPARQPEWVDGALGGKPAIRFTADQLNTVGLLSANRTPFTFFAVTSNTNDPFALFDSAPQVVNPFRFGAFGPPFGSPNFAVELWDRSPAVGLSVNPTGSIVAVTAYRNAATNRVLEVRETSFNGKEFNSATGNTAPVAFGGNGGPKIGSINNGGNGYYNGDLSELIIFTGQLTDDDRTAVETYLGNEYGVKEGPLPPPAVPSAIGNYGRTILAANPVAYWRLETNDQPPTDTANALGFPQFGAQDGIYQNIDYRSLAQPGPRPTDTINGQPLLGFAADNKATRFRGNAGGGDDVVLFADDGNLNMSTGLAFTLEAWVKAEPAGHDGGGAIIAKGPGGGGEQFAIDLVNGRYRFFCWNGGAPNTPTVIQSAVAPSTAWDYVVGVFDQAEGLMKLYVNGVEVGSATPPLTIVNNLHDISLGARKNANSNNYDLNYNGLLDEVAVYAYALPDSEILAHFNAAMTAPQSTNWNVDASGNWGDIANWSSFVPDAPGATANFLGVITAGATVTLETNRIVGAVEFDNANSYTIAGPGLLILDNNGSAASLKVTSGNHIITADVVLFAGAAADIAAGSSLGLAGGLNLPAGQSLTKDGEGTLSVGYVRGTELVINAGVVSINPNGGDAGVSVLNSINISPNGILDLADNDLVVVGGSIDQISALVALGRAGGSWSGTGIISSTAAAPESNGITGLAVEANDFGMTEFSGQPVGPGDILVKYTYNGDADLSGLVDADDYFLIDSGFAQGLIGYRNGDFDYSGVVDADDYFLIDTAFALEGATLANVAAVPEPGVAACALFAGLGLAIRKRRR